MARKKLLHFSDLDTMAHVFEYTDDEPILWQEYFGNKNPITLEIGCGRGAYTLGLAKMYPDRNFIGIDVKGARLWHGATEAANDKLKNIAFLRTRVEDLEKFFTTNEISEIWITFPDPHPREGKTKKRLTYKRFLNLYKAITIQNSAIHLKTDNKPLFDYSIESITEYHSNILIQTSDLYSDFPEPSELHIKTQYESIYLEKGVPICYVKFNFLLVQTQ